MIADLVYGAVSADLLGVPHETMKRALRARAQRFTPRDYLHFDPTCEPIPDDVPRPCTRCGTRSARGSAACVRCQAALRMLDRYNIFFNAMVTTYFGDVSGITLGAHLADVLRWLPGLRPYRWSGSKPDRAFYRIAYTITHIVYVLNDYGRHHVPPDWLPQEFDFLQRYLQVLIEGDDPEALGEFIECLRAFGLTDTDSWIRRGIDFLLASQHSDGSWGDSNEPNIYTRYHTTWTCINALMDVDWKPPKAHRLAI